MSQGAILNKGTDGFSKEQIWSEATASLFGLGADSTPEDGFKFLGKFNSHWWRRRTIAYVETKGIGESNMYFSGTNHNPNIIYYSDSVDVSTGEPQLISPKSISVRGTDLTLCKNTFPGKYVKGLIAFASGNPMTGIYFIGSDATFKTLNSHVTIYGCYLVSATKQLGPYEYLQSKDRSTYPDSGIQGGYEYEYLGIPFDNVMEAPKIKTGSYVGTGAYGSSNPNSLTFEFVPKLVVVSGGNAQFTTVNGDESVYSRYTSSFYQISVRWNEKSVSWYTLSSNVNHQLNSSGVTYNYLALG